MSQVSQLDWMTGSISMRHQAPQIAKMGKFLSEERRVKLVKIMNDYRSQGKTWPQIEKIMWDLVQDLYDTRFKIFMAEGNGPGMAHRLAEDSVADIVGTLAFIPFSDFPADAGLMPV